MRRAILSDRMNPEIIDKYLDRARYDSVLSPKLIHNRLNASSKVTNLKLEILGKYTFYFFLQIFYLIVSFQVYNKVE